MSVLSVTDPVYWKRTGDEKVFVSHDETISIAVFEVDSCVRVYLLIGGSYNNTTEFKYYPSKHAEEEDKLPSILRAGEHVLPLVSQFMPNVLAFYYKNKPEPRFMCKFDSCRIIKRSTYELYNHFVDKHLG